MFWAGSFLSPPVIVTGLGRFFLLQIPFYLYYNTFMNHKLLIVKLDFKPELNRHQDLSILLSKDHLLPTAKSLTKFREIFNNQPKLGKIFFETPDSKYYFAIITPNKIPENYSYIKFSNLSNGSTPDYKIILKAIKILGYEF